MIVPLILMAIALSMDAFSVSLGIGMQKLPFRRIFFIGIGFGFFHLLFPVLGIFIGKVISETLSQYTVLLSGILLIFIGFHMFFSAFSSSNLQNKRLFKPSGLGIVALAITVSIDSFPIGLSLGLSNVQTVLALFFFGSFSTLFTWTGLMLGQKVQGFLGSYSELLGGSILLSFGFHMVFSS